MNGKINRDKQGERADGRQGNRADRRRKEGTDINVLVMRQVKYVSNLCACQTRIQGRQGICL